MGQGDLLAELDVIETAGMLPPDPPPADAAVLAYRADPTPENRAALLDAQRTMVQATNARITSCHIARTRGEHATGGCPECGAPPPAGAVAETIRARWAADIAAARAKFDHPTQEGPTTP